MDTKKDTKKEYDKNNVFYKIINNQLPSKKVYESDSVLAFHDINPASKVHVLVIPKKEYVDYSDFISNAQKDEIAEFFIEIEKVAKEYLNLDDYKLITNCGSKSGQVVFHFHVHIIA